MVKKNEDQKCMSGRALQHRSDFHIVPTLRVNSSYRVRVGRFGAKESLVFGFCLYVLGEMMTTTWLTWNRRAFLYRYDS
jgi:hypothetical protein